MVYPICNSRFLWLMLARKRSLSLSHTFPNFSSVIKKTPKIIFNFPRNPYHRKRLESRTIRWRGAQFSYHLPDKISRHIHMNIGNYLRYFKIII